MININSIENRIAELMGLPAYVYIQENYMKKDLRKDVEFQRVYNGFYSVRRNAEWRNIYYDIFQDIKTKKAYYDFEYIIRSLYKETGNIEASFSSKMLATLDCNKPIYDRYVLKNLDIIIKERKAEERIKECIAAYNLIENYYKSFYDSKESIICIEKFDNLFPDYTMISKAKKIDFFLNSDR